jgi:DNA-binding transcriptional ArsR family regulator
MSDFLQKISGTRSQPAQQGTLCDLGDDSDARVFNVLGSETARRIYLHLQDETATASEIAKHADTSIQNAQYHLTKLREVELVEVADTEYSSKGSEMNIYAATNDPLIIVSGSESRLEKVRARLSDLLGGIALILGGSVLVQWLTQQEILGIGSFSIELLTHARPTSAPAEPEPWFWLPPGLIFFVGGLTVLLGVLVWSAIQSE